jgi:hypothetical protein
MTLGSHQMTVGKSQSYITPPVLLLPLGPFDTDPCTSTPQPWLIGTKFNFTERDDGLSRPWEGRVFVNPPFDTRGVHQWVERIGKHGRGILLVHVRPETSWFGLVWEYASGILFLRHRVNFYLPDGSRCPHNSGAPVCLASYGADDLQVLKSCKLDGVLVTEWNHGRRS